MHGAASRQGHSRHFHLLPKLLARTETSAFTFTLSFLCSLSVGRGHDLVFLTQHSLQGREGVRCSNVAPLETSGMTWRKAFSYKTHSPYQSIIFKVPHTHISPGRWTIGLVATVQRRSLTPSTCSPREDNIKYILKKWSGRSYIELVAKDRSQWRPL
jgi:hypothetical protein